MSSVAKKLPTNGPLQVFVCNGWMWTIWEGLSGKWYAKSVPPAVKAGPFASSQEARGWIETRRA